MAFPVPTVEVAFTTPPLSDSPVWEDISYFVELQENIQVERGRGDEFDVVNPSQCQFTLDNSDGRFTVGRAVLADGVTANPYYPDVKDGRKVRVRDTWSGNPSFKDDTAGWLTTNLGIGTFTRSTAQTHYHGVASGLITPSGSNAFPAVFQDTSIAVAVEEGETCTGGAFVYSPNGYADVRIRIDWRDATDTIFDNTSPDIFDVPAGEWVHLTTGGTAPAGAVNASVRVIMGATPAASDLLHVTDAGLVYDRFTGYVNQWPTEWENGTPGRALGRVTATDRFKRVSTAGELLSAIEQEVLIDEPEMYYVLNEDSESAAAGNTSGTTRPAGIVRTLGSGTLEFGSGEAPGFDGMSAAVWDAPHDDNDVVLHTPGNSAWLTVPLQPNVVFDSTSNGMTYECWAKCAITTPATKGSYRFMNAYDRVRVGAGSAGEIFGGASFGIDSANNLYTFISDGVLAGDDRTYTGATYMDDTWHHFVATFTPNTTNIRVRLYADGVMLLDGNYGTGTSSASCDTLHIGEDAYAADGDSMLGSLAHVAVYTHVLSDARITAHYEAGADGFTGDTSGARVERLAGYADVPVSQTDLEDGLSVLGPVAVRGDGAIEALQDVARSENGIVYVNRSGELAFQGRDHRYNQASTFTLDAEAHELGADTSFMSDDAYRRNDILVTRSPGPSLRRSDSASIEDFGRYRDDMESLTSSDEEAIDAAEYRLQAYADPGPRISTFTVSLHEDESRYPDLLGMELGDKITVTNLPSNAPASTLALWVEGYTEVVGVNEYRMTITTSPVLDGQDGLWRLGVAGESELGSTTVLGYGNSAPALVSGQVPVPRTWVDTTDWPSAAAFNVEIRDMVRWMVEPPAAKFYGGTTGTTQALTNNTVTDIVWNYESHKQDVIHSTNADENPSWIVINTPGLYLVSCRIEITAETTPSGRRDLQIMKNGSTLVAQENMPQPATDVPSRLSLTGTYEMAAGDRFTAQVLQTSGQALNLSADECEIAVKWVAKLSS